MNQVNLIGRLTKDPELKYTPGAGTAVTTFNIAVDRIYKKDGQPDADFLPIVVWGKTAESAAQYLAKGKLVGVTGRLQTRSYDHKDGYKVYVTEIVASELKFIEWGSKKESAHEEYQDMVPVEGDDIPF